MTAAELIRKRAWVSKQLKQATESHPVVTCRCDNNIPLRYMYRCFDCGEYFCEGCATEHFGRARFSHHEEAVTDD